MTKQLQRPAHGSELDDDETLLDVKTVSCGLRYMVHAVGRRRRLAAVVFASTLSLSLVAVLVVPRSYQVSTRILTHKSYVMPALVHPRRAVPLAADAPTRGATDLMMARDMLLHLVDDTRLVELVGEKQGWLGRAKRSLRERVAGKAKPEELREGLIKALEKKLAVRVEGDVVTLTVEWNRADIAMQLAEAAVARFLKLRRDMELGELVETVNILERNTEGARQRIDEVVSNLQRVVKERERDIQRRTAAGQPVARLNERTPWPGYIAVRRPLAAAAPAADSHDLVDLRQRLRVVQATVENLKRDQERRMQTSQERLADLRASLGPEHPDVAEAARDFEVQSKQPAQLAALVLEEERLTARLQDELRRQPAGGVGVGGAAASTPPLEPFEMVRLPVSEELAAGLRTDPEIERVMEELRKRQIDYDDVSERLWNARVEIETATAGFSYRYIITKPPIFPKEPAKPKAAVMAAGGLVVALCLGLFVAIAADVVAMRVLEAWQIDRFLRLRVLGEVVEP